MFTIGQTFENEYPPEAAVWCNENNAYIDEVSTNIFEIKEVPPPTSEELAEQIRRQRDRLLRESDWAMLSDAPLDEETKAQYITYRQALRDMPQQLSFPEQTTWPKNPKDSKVVSIFNE